MTREADTRKRKGFENIMYYVAIFKRQDEEERQEIQVACEAGKGLKRKKTSLVSPERPWLTHLGFRASNSKI